MVLGVKWAVNPSSCHRAPRLSSFLSGDNASSVEICFWSLLDISLLSVWLALDSRWPPQPLQRFPHYQWQCLYLFRCAHKGANIQTSLFHPRHKGGFKVHLPNRVQSKLLESFRDTREPFCCAYLTDTKGIEGNYETSQRDKSRLHSIAILLVYG